MRQIDSIYSMRAGILAIGSEKGRLIMNSVEKVRKFLNFHARSDKVGQFGRDWIETKLNRLDEATKEYAIPPEFDTLIGSMAYDTTNILAIMRDDMPCHAFFVKCCEFFEELAAQIEHEVRVLAIRKRQSWGAANLSDAPAINFDGGGRY